MRRQEREVKDRVTVDAVLHEANVLHLAMWDGHEPYVVPLNFGYDGESIYFHTAQDGRKNQIFSACPSVCFQVETDVEIKRGGENACGWGCRYRSVIGHGQVERLQDPDRVVHALRTIMAKYAGHDDFAFTDGCLQGVAVWRVVIERVTGKQSMPMTAE